MEKRVGSEMEGGGSGSYFLEIWRGGRGFGSDGPSEVRFGRGRVGLFDTCCKRRGRGFRLGGQL